MRSSYYSFWLFAAMCSAAPAQAEFATAYRAYERGDYATASSQFSEAAEQGHAAAQISLGWMYAQGLGVPRDDQQALYWYRQAAKQGHPDAQAILYIRGLGKVPRHRTAVDRGPEGPGQLTLERVYPGRYQAESHEGTRPENAGASAAYWYRKFAELGRRDAQFTLAVRYELGQDIPQDALRATYWYRKAAQRGSALAQFNLGLKYAIGDGVPLDQSMALFWYQRAADQGHLESQFLVGVAYARGDGVPPAATQAVRWWREAAQGDYAPAQYHLGLMYAQGKGVPKDWPQAYLWFSLAAVQGHDDARRSRDEVGARIGPTEMARVQRLARRWGSLDNKLKPTLGNLFKAPTDGAPTRSFLKEGGSPQKS